MAQANYVPSPDCAPITDATVRPSTNPILSAYGGLLDWLAAQPPSPIPINAQAADLESRRADLDELLSRTSVYVRVLLEDAAQNVPRDIDLRQIEALLADLASEVAGTLRVAAHALPGRLS
jgi:hypothetical protein